MLARLCVGDPRSEPDDVRLDAAGSLCEELRREGMPVRQSQEVPPPGAKAAGGGSLAELIITGALSSAAVYAFAQIVVAFVQRGAARRVLFEKDGESLDVTGLSARDQRRMIEQWLRDKAGEDHPAVTEVPVDAVQDAPRSSE